MYFETTPCYLAVTYLVQGQCDIYSKILSQKKKEKTKIKILNKFLCTKIFGGYFFPRF